MTDRLNDVVIIRSLAIIMVVAFHAYYMMMVEGLSILTVLLLVCHSYLQEIPSLFCGTKAFV